MKWQIKPERGKTNGHKKRWRWRLFDDSGTLLQVSEPFLSRERCLRDAEANGFMPANLSKPDRSRDTGTSENTPTNA